ncbi:DUF596 domain-containing protein [Rudanella paleaurantiibacter]|uniref:DUF596 domain-containing protein n=1 Tax=Rudanella paleaurantiibacter TaxID=2614655 RepID=A0A7J5U083_9BACT|nr:DUF596 domain-containing protein [Rudanella paleaurantiibacter]KAB7731158.1 DUF596 domain-containing protein [Rudanella paleaurantiibacter]
MISKASLDKIITCFLYQDLEHLWFKTERWDFYDFPQTISEDYHQRVQLFCYVLEHILNDNLAVLAKNGVFLVGSPTEQANLFQKAFPADEATWDEHSAYWWFLDECPGSIVWYIEDDNGGVLTTPVGDGRFYYWP